jgi:hypothetical protein
MKILGDVLNFVFIAGVNDTGDKLFTGANATPVYSGFHKFRDTGD